MNLGAVDQASMLEGYVVDQTNTPERTRNALRNAA